mmetsp:Transcript_10154/g.12819  ORF Transcript_10154/g.12819 Transcript_10154/m.12819 type:complete len:80 (+) Transcript_10154:196-435(+)|eukprot:CAMPEP_0203635942 /NCGR_PEP_ID=MMETSP0088-20131115/2603_1 /ASSEMBLY_ACC=CAM_ASM_001087 /TAXON_ID=426623 /ORGANISM="Chaetoceros affinis, Strain CCMP159" /LENGTH=79 /DNA_ID=CAMNT_0050489953 /DNA_START=196 /DNA_END=435 /DNA_ORIENTATION=-
MGGQQSKENNLDKLQDSRDAMRHRDENHLAKAGKSTDISYIPRREGEGEGEAIVEKKNSTNATTKPMMKKKPSIVCSET